MGKWKWFVAATCLVMMSCSLVFSAEDKPGGTDPVVNECEGVQRIYDRGEAVPGDTQRFQFLDYAQGTITFWAKSLKEVSGEVEMINLAGIRVIARPDGSIRAELPANDALQVFTTDAGVVTWDEDGDVFIALRWDSKRPVSGHQGLGFHAMLRVGANHHKGGVKSNVEFVPAAATELIVGDSDGAIQIDQLVVYGLPLYVDNDYVNGPDELREVSKKKEDSALLVRGGVEVSFATSAPFHDGCDSYEALAWSMPIYSEMPGLARSGGKSSNFADGVSRVDVPTEELIFSSAMGFDNTTPFWHVDLELDSSATYSLYALAHGAGTATPQLRIYSMEDAALDMIDATLVEISKTNSSVDHPIHMFATFQMPDDLQIARLELANRKSTGSDIAVFHTIIIRKSYFTNASFEVAADDGETPAGWEARADEGVIYQGDNGDAVNTGSYSSCFYGSGTRSDVSQIVDSSKLTLKQEEFYASGAMFFKGTTSDAVTPGVTTGNSGFWGTGAPQEARERVQAASESEDNWRPAGVVAYRLYGPEYEASNEHIYFGGLGGQPNDVLDHCIDDAYFYPVTKIEGLPARP